MRHPIIVTTNKAGSRLRVHWTDEDTEIARDIIGEIPDQIIKPNIFITVAGYKNVAPYTRSLPGKVGIGRVLGGPEFFTAAGALISVGFQTYDDGNRSDLTGHKKLGRASIAILEGVSGLGLLHLGALLFFPAQAHQFDQWKDKATADMFTSKNVIVNELSNVILKAGGKRFQDWSMKPCWIDYFCIAGSRLSIDCAQWLLVSLGRC